MPITLTVLMENTAGDPRCLFAHGLSLLLETPQHRILFDTGPDGNFLKNAELLAVDITAVDTCVISHAHADHTGGLEAFLHANTRAQIYVRPEALAQYASVRNPAITQPIGMGEAAKKNPRLHLSTPLEKIDSELTLFQSPRIDEILPSNIFLRKEENGKWVQDDFLHEQNLIIKTPQTSLLLVGCAHAGADRILQEAFDILGHYPDAMIGGFHFLQGPNTDEATTERLAEALAHRLMGTPTRCYTCHCTGTLAFKRMKALMGEQVSTVATGDRVVF